MARCLDENINREGAKIMSSFIVSKETIENILNGIEACGVRAKKIALNDYTYLSEAKYDAQKFGEELADLNQRAVNTRYKEAEKSVPVKYDVKCVDKTLKNLMKAQVSLQCLKYQCDEFDYEEPIFRILDKLEVLFLREIVELMSIYNEISDECWK